MLSAGAAARRRACRAAGALACAVLLMPSARADGLEALKAFTRDVRSARAAFTQTVTAPDGTRKKPAVGRFEFLRPDRFRFSYSQPFEQVIVGDGQKLWLHDIDLNQVSVRPMSQALGALPASLLAGASLDQAFTVTAQPTRDGLDWVQALPKAKEGSVQQVRIGFRAGALAALEITDAFGQRSLLQFSDLQVNPPLAESGFRFTPPKGAEVVGG